MNILFVNYGDFTSNSLNHIGGFANALCAQGHACAVAVPVNRASISAFPRPNFVPATFEEVLSGRSPFPNGLAADIIHAWTPREHVRKFVLAYQRLARARLVIHLEDNEDFLISSWTHEPVESIRALSEAQLAERNSPNLSHPIRYRQLLRVADGATYIVPSLAEFVPKDCPSLLLEPGVAADYQPQPADPALRRELGLRDDERVIAFTGSNTFANEPEMRDLYLAVALLNQAGTPTRLLRTGLSSPSFQEALPEHAKAHVLDLGFVEKSKLPRLLALADVLVQPGQPGPFNDYRLPSKLPEFLAAGRPVITPAANIGRELRDGVDAILLKTGAPAEIVKACQRIFQEPQLAAELAKNGAAVARKHFDLAANTAALLAFYQKLRSAPLRRGSTAEANGGSELSLVLRRVAEGRADGAAEVAAEIAPLVEHLESSDPGRPERERLEKERDHWRHHHGLAREHGENLEKRVKLTDQQVEALSERIRLTDQHVANLTDELSKQVDDKVKELTERIRLTDQHVTNLTNELTDARGRVTRMQNTVAINDKLLAAARQQMDSYENLLKTSRDRIGTLETDAQAAKERTGVLQKQLALTEQHAANLLKLRDALEEKARSFENQAVAEHDQRLEREAKIKSMQASFSWQVTSPLRWLRRALLDGPKKKVASHAEAPRKGVTGKGEASEYAGASLAAPDPRSSISDLQPPIPIWHSVDNPRSWTLPPKKVTLRGWCFAEDARKLDGVRAVLTTGTVEGTYGFKRLDVVASVRDKPQAEYCGWKIEVEFREADDSIALEARDDRGTWHRFFQNQVRVGENLGVADLTSYEQWAKTYDSLDPEKLRAQQAAAARLGTTPLISVVMPVYNTPERWLLRVIESIRSQTYPHWELCIADDASPEPHVRRILEQARESDKRIKVEFRPKNGHISAASNSALALATGDYVALLDHDDELTPDALFEVASAINARPEADYFYSDEDKIDEEGRRFEPYFKPDFLPDLFLGQNYLSHLSVYRTALIRKVGGFREGYEGSQDWDLALRAIEQTSRERIVHIPKVLYHWRAIPGSTALLLSEKSYPVEAARRALADHFTRSGIKAELLPVPGDHWRVKYPLPSPAPKVSLIIPTHNGLRLLERCVESILTRTTYPNYEIVIVDNRSDDRATLHWLEQVEARGVKVLPYPHPFNYSAINNFAVAATDGEVIGLLNNDLEVINADWLEELVSQASRPGVGCVGAMLYYPNDAIQHAGVVIGLGGVAGHAFRDFPRGSEGKFNRARLVQNYSAVTAACLVVRRAVYVQVGGLDERDLAVAFNDIDFCLKVREAGYRNLWTPFAELYHHESASRGTDDTPEKEDRFRREVETMLRRWGPALSRDPAYNPNLTLELNDFSLASPPRR